MFVWPRARDGPRMHSQNREYKREYPELDERGRMPASGELIRMMNYMDDVTATLRRMIANVPFLTDDERKRLADYMRKADPSVTGLIDKLEKGNGK